MASALECRVKPESEDFVGESKGDNAPAHRQDVRVVVLARQTRCIEIVAQRRADAGNLVGGDLLALAAAAEHDTTIGPSLDDGAGHADADRRIVDRRLAIGPVVVDDVAVLSKGGLQMLFEEKPGVIGADSDAHDARLYYGFMVQGSGFKVQGSGFTVR